MALVRCGECGTEISDKAAACIKCGAPAAPAAAIGIAADALAAQQTGKWPKLLQLIGFLLLSVGVVVAVADAKSGQGAVTGAAPGMILFGVVLYAVGRVSAWWKHG